MVPLLTAAARGRFAPSYAAQLTGSTGPVLLEPARRDAPVDPLSDRELDVLRLLATDLGGPDIARELVVSLNTVRTHTRNIYAKLGVTNRRAAVRRATELDVMGG
jgi:LuxR family maltose regulon positive regulatory protein